MACVQIDECVAGESRTVRARRAGFVAALAFSALMGLALMFVLVTPQRVGMVRTPELAGMLGLLLLPLATAWVVAKPRGGTRREPGATERAVAPPTTSQEQDASWQIVIPVEMYQPRALASRSSRARLDVAREPGALATRRRAAQARPRRQQEGLDASQVARARLATPARVASSARPARPVRAA